MDGLILVPSVHEPSNRIYDRVSVVVQRTRVLAAVFVRRTKPHTVDRNCKMLYAFQFTICLVEEGGDGGGGDHFFSSSVWGEEKGFKANSKMQDAVEVSNVGAYGTRVSLLHFIPPDRGFLLFYFSLPPFCFCASSCVWREPTEPAAPSEGGQAG